MAKRLLIFGPPGAGKGTHAKRLARDLGIPHIATGDMFREEISRGTAFGRRAEEYLRRGEFVPDDMVVPAIEDRLAKPDAQGGYLLDGFPRTPPQAAALQQHLAKTGGGIDGVIFLEVPEEVLVRRIAGRAVCGSCQAVFNRTDRPSRVAGRCDACDGSLVVRADDQEPAVRRRLADYAATTRPVLDFFGAAHWPVRTVSSVGNVDDVYARIRAAAEA